MMSGRESVTESISTVGLRHFFASGAGQFELSMSPAGYDDLKREVLNPDRPVFYDLADGPYVPMTEIEIIQLDSGSFHITVNRDQRMPFLVTPRSE